ncbi:ABC transporter permease [Alkalibacter sp. M17DMB]|nr:ABC transporter permease [Alkalibacter mobilis]
MKSFKLTKTLYSFIFVLIFWYLLHISVKTAAIPSPYETIVNFVEIFPQKLSLHLGASMGRVFLALGISIVLGSMIGIWTGISPKADSMISPLVYLLYPIPKIAFLPILMILFGLGDLPKILLIVIIIIFQFTMAARDGVKEIPRELTYSVKSLGLTKPQMYLHLVIPAILPKIITTARISLGAAVSVLFFAENFATTYGIGYFIMNQWAMVNYKEMFSGILALSLAGFVIFLIIDLIENIVCKWVQQGRQE